MRAEKADRISPSSDNLKSAIVGLCPEDQTKPYSTVSSVPAFSISPLNVAPLPSTLVTLLVWITGYFCWAGSAVSSHPDVKESVIRRTNANRWKQIFLINRYC